MESELEDSGGASSSPALYWGVKESFLRYLSMLPDGGYEANDGATLIDGQSFRFSSVPDSMFDEASGMGTLKFRGAVLLQGHGRLLRVRIVDPWLRLDGEKSTLTICDPNRPGAEGARLRLAAVTSKSPIGHGQPATFAAQLDAECVPLFGGQYAAGEELSPLTVLREFVDQNANNN